VIHGEAQKGRAYLEWDLHEGENEVASQQTGVYTFIPFNEQIVDLANVMMLYTFKRF
jgi:hypothetical protein